MKDELLKIFKENLGQYVSGEKISKEFGVTRTSIWKLVNELRDEGFIIESHSRKGYRLVSIPDLINPEEIRKNLKTTFIGRNIIFLKSVDSTNAYAKEMGKEGMQEAVVLAEEQTRGRGRLGRMWHSPKGSGIWMSILLRPDFSPEYASQITQLTGLAVSESIRNIAGIDAFIKWPNDIIINQKKVSGILTEMVAEMDKIDYLVIGIGINVNTEYFPEDIIKIATSLKKEAGIKIDRNLLVAEILNRFEKYYMEFLKEKSLGFVIDKLKELSCTIGERIIITKMEEVLEAMAVDLDIYGNLIIRRDDGMEERIASGEVSVRGILGYC